MTPAPHLRRGRVRVAAALALAALLPAAASGQRSASEARFTPAPLAPPSSIQKDLTLDDIYDPDKKVAFDGNPPRNLEWIDDAHYLWPKTDPRERATEMIKVEALTGKAEPLFDVPKVESTLAALEGVSPDEAKRTARQSSYTFGRKRTALLLTVGDDLYLYDLVAHRAVRLTRMAGKEEEATLSPDGAWAAFVRGNNLYVVEVRTQRERALTSDGSADLLNGKLDWVYQEEIYGRGKFRAYWWSPGIAVKKPT